jgi:hypothetical protein
VCVAGLPSTTIDTLQRGGRAYRNSAEDALFVIFYDSWVHDINPSDFTNFDSADLDRPRAILKPNSPRRERVPYHGVRLIRDKSCIRKQFALYLNDQLPDGKLNIISILLIVMVDINIFKLQDIRHFSVAVSVTPTALIFKPFFRETCTACHRKPKILQLVNVRESTLPIGHQKNDQLWISAS